MNRPWLRQKVFSDTQKRIVLEKITHPRIREEIIRDLQSSTSEYTVLVSPLLIESGQFKLVQRVVVVDVPEDLQISRTCARDANEAEQVRRIIAAQISRAERLDKADDVLDNSGTLQSLLDQTNKLHQKLLAHC